MLVTVMTDASVCPTGAAGYGFWIVSKRGGTPGGSPFKTLIKDSYEGEFKAVVNAISYGLKHALIEATDEILVQLDNKGVVSLLNNQVPPRSDTKEAYDILKSLIQTNQITLRARHVKGHSNVKDQRSKANKMCDMRARLAMKEARKQINADTSSKG